MIRYELFSLVAALISYCHDIFTSEFVNNEATILLIDEVCYLEVIYTGKISDF